MIWEGQLEGCWAGRGATEQVTCRDANGKTRDSAKEAKIQGPGCCLGSDTLGGIQDSGKRDPRSRSPKSDRLRPWE